MATANIQTMGTLFPEAVSKELFNQVRGKSSLAKLADQVPVEFTGTDIFTFSFDNEVSVVAENEEKVPGGITVAAKKIAPIKIEYGARVTDEFMYASEEKQLQILQAFTEGFAKKVAKGLDIMAMHGYNPFTGAASLVIGTNNLDAQSTKVAYTGVDADIASGVAAIGDYDMTGLVLSKTAAAELAATKVNGVTQYPELMWGAVPDSIHGVPVDVNATVSANEDIYAYGGDFEAFKWGYARNIEMNVIPYGDPDNTGSDLAGHNQVYLRAECYIGWAILDGGAFFRIDAAEDAGDGE